MLDVCVVSYRTPEFLSSFLTAYKSDVITTGSKLLLRVNDPSEADIRVLENKFVDVKGAVALGDNIGYANSVNELVSMGSNEIIGIFNADVIPSADVWMCVEYLENYPDVGVVGPRQVDSSGRRLVCGGGIAGSLLKPEYRYWKKLERNHPPEIVDVNGVIGSAYFIRRSVWEELIDCPEYSEFLRSRGLREGAFLPTQHWYEETFCSTHVRHHGYRIVYLGTARMTHALSKSGMPPGGRRTVWQASKDLYREACSEVHGMECEL